MITLSDLFSSTLSLEYIYSYDFSCIEANLNGLYRQTPKDHNYVGIVWEGWHGDYSLKSTRMMMRSKPVDVEEEARLGRTPPDDP